MWLKNHKLIISFLFLIGPASAQITRSGTYGGHRSITDLIGDLIGVRMHDPYEAIGLVATIGLLWISTYIIMKITVMEFDKNLNNDDSYGASSTPFQSALGLADENDKNLLAVISLLVVLSMIGTGAFIGVLHGWQSLILLTFSLGILAALAFILIGGTGAAIGGSAMVAGGAAKATAAGAEQLYDGIERIQEAENKIRDQEEEEENHVDDQPEQADQNAHMTEEQLEQVINALENATDEMDNLMNEELHELSGAVENLEEILELLDLDG